MLRALALSSPALTLDRNICISAEIKLYSAMSRGRGRERGRGRGRRPSSLASTDNTWNRRSPFTEGVKLKMAAYARQSRGSQLSYLSE